MKNLLNQYRESIEQIHEYFGYEESWHVSPIEDCTDLYWKLTDSGVTFFDEHDEYSNDFLHGTMDDVYRTEAYTMIEVDTHCDGNKFLQIFDNSKELK